jgi:PTH1 family peptidyl-tRNA hydrolase
MFLVAGLGNPGRRYRDDRHNLGFKVVEELARRLGIALDREQCNARVAESADVLLAQPQTYMNRSGHALRCLVELREIPAEKVLVVFDDVHLPLGRLRIRAEGGPGGHRGMESIVENLRTLRVARLRLGAGPPLGEGALPEDLADLVLSPFADAEQPAVTAMIAAAADAADCWMREGMAVAMNRFNGNGRAQGESPPRTV